MSFVKINQAIFCVALICYIAYISFFGFNDNDVFALTIFFFWSFLCIPRVGQWYAKHLKFSVPMAGLFTILQIFYESYSIEVWGTFVLSVLLIYPLLVYPFFLFLRAVYKYIFVPSVKDAGEALKEFSAVVDTVKTKNGTRMSEEEFRTTYSEEDLQPYLDRGVDLDLAIPLWCKWFKVEQLKSLQEVHKLDLIYDKEMAYFAKIRLKDALNQLPGLGQKKVTALVSKYGNKENLKSASSEDIAKIPGISKANAIFIQENL